MTTVITREQGYTGFSPEIIRIVTTATLTQVTTAGWYNNSPISGESISNVDQILICYAYGSSSQATTLFDVSISASGVVTLSVGESSVILPVTSGHFANFSGTSGAIKDDGYLPSNAALTRVVMQSGASVAGNAPKYNDITGTIIDSGIAFSALSQQLSTVSNNHVTFTQVFTLTFTQLASAGKVNIVTHPSATATFFIQDVKVLKSTGLSGGGGDRLLAISDGTTVFNNAGITAAVLGTPVFTLWGGTGNPIPNGATDISAAGADIYFQYTGGTTDYTAGSVMIAVTCVQLVA